MTTLTPTSLRLFIYAAVSVSTLAASAYLAPVEERCGVRVEIGSFPQKTERPGKNPYAWPLGVTEVEAGAPRTFPVTLENRTGMPIAGELEVWMNDDWDVSGPQGPLKLDVWMNDGWDVAYPKGPIVLESGEKSVVFRGFTARVDTGDGSAPPEAKASIREEKGTLRISWSIPGVTRDATGFPRIVDLAVGPASEKPHRVYMGFGNVIEGPRAFTFVAHGSRLSTRHVGADYANGLSVVQAVDVVQDSVVCDGERNLFSLHAHHDATFTFVPSSKGSFEAGRRFRAVSGYKASPGHATLGSRMCLDLWGCDYAMETAGIARAAKYGPSSLT